VTSYLNVVEIESAIANLAVAYPGLCSLRALPEPSSEGRVSHALHLSTQSAAMRPTLLLSAGMHACEWGGAEILISFVADLLAAYTAEAALQYGNKVIAAPTIKRILDELDVVIFPLVNPDGLDYSLNHDSASVSGWRKNRNVQSSGGQPDSVGVDINRNFDFLWDFQTKLGRGDPVVSDVPKDPEFHGTAPFSEPESRNLRWLLDATPATQWFIDLHACSPAILYNWGDDENQSIHPKMNYRNAAWDGKRGGVDDEYGEYIPPHDGELAEQLAQSIKDAIFAVRGTDYPITQSFGYYAVSGAAADYAYARQWETSPKPRVVAFTIEFGEDFHPVWSKMEPVIADVCGGLFGFCEAVLGPPQ
jgi:murein tripeptide amidase MpaA